MINEATGRCPLCDGVLRLWIGLPDSVQATVGMPSPIDPKSSDAAARARLIDRCDECKAGIVRGTDPIDLEHELRAISYSRNGSEIELRTANRASLQAGIGREAWAGLGLEKGRILHTPRSLELLAELTENEFEGAGFPPWGPSQAWMWQTLLNGLTLHPNFAREVRAGRLRMANARSRFAFVADLIATVLAAPLVALVSVPLEALAALLKRGGAIVARIDR